MNISNIKILQTKLARITVIFAPFMLPHHSSCRPATGERGSDEQHIYDTAGGGSERPEETIYEEFPEEKLEKLKAKAAAASGAGAAGGGVDGSHTPVGSLYEAIYDYEGQAEGDLTFKAGDVIEVRLCWKCAVQT